MSINNEVIVKESTSNNRMRLFYYGSLLTVLLLMLGMSFWYGLSGDEVDMNEFGKAVLKFYTSFGADETVFNMPKEFDRDSILKYYGGFYDTLCAILTKFSPFDVFTTRHIFNAFIGFLAIFFSSKIAVRVLHYQAGTIAVWLMFFSPFFLGQAMNNPKDVPFATFYIMAIYGMIRLFDHLPKPSVKDYLFAILPIGFAISSRIAGILLIPEMFVLVALLWFFKKSFQQETVSIGSYFKPLIITSLFGYLAGCLFWPFGLIDPINNPFTALHEMSNLKVSLRQLFEGQKVMSTEFPSYYLPKMFTITNTFAVMGGLALMLVFLWSFRKNKNAGIVTFVAFTAFFPFAYIIYSKSNVYHSWRHILFVFPSAIVCATLGWQLFIDILNKYKLKIAGWGLLALLMLDPVYFTATTFPHTNTYYNQLVGGTSGAYGNYEVDFYYNSLKESTNWFKQNELPKWKSKDSVIIATNAVHLLTKYFTSNEKIIYKYVRFNEKNQTDWDYAFFHIALLPAEDIKNKTWLPAKNTIFQSNVQGNTLNAIIKRGNKNDIKGFEFLKQNLADSALIYFKNYLEEDADNVTILNMVGNIYMQKNQIVEAETYINNSYKKDSSNPETQNMYGVLAIQKNDFATAQTIFSKLIQENPQYAQGYFYLGIAQLNLGNYQQALTNFNTASQDENIRLNSYKFMGDAYIKMGNTTEAAKMYQLAGMK